MANIEKKDTLKQYSSDRPIGLSVSQPGAAQMFNVSERTIQSVKAVEREAPELIPEIENGKIHRQGAPAPE